MGDCSHTVEPGIYNRSVVLYPANSSFWTKFQVANVMRQGVGKRESAVSYEVVVAIAANRLQEDQRLMQGQRTDGILQQQFQLFGRKALQRRGRIAVRGEERKGIPGIDTLVFQGPSRC